MYLFSWNIKFIYHSLFDNWHIKILIILLKNGSHSSFSFCWLVTLHCTSYFQKSFVILKAIVFVIFAYVVSFYIRSIFFIFQQNKYFCNKLCCIMISFAQRKKYINNLNKFSKNGHITWFFVSLSNNLNYYTFKLQEHSGDIKCS